MASTAIRCLSQLGPGKNFNYKLTCMDLKDLRSGIIIGAAACLGLNEHTGRRALLPGESCSGSIPISRGNLSATPCYTTAHLAAVPVCDDTFLYRFVLVRRWWQIKRGKVLVALRRWYRWYRGVGRRAYVFITDLCATIPHFAIFRINVASALVYERASHFIPLKGQQEHRPREKRHHTSS